MPFQSMELKVHTLRLLMQKNLRGDKTYYQLSVDFDYSKDIDLSGGTVLGDFVAHSKHKTLF